MGAWGTGPFENDDAADWLAELADSDDLEAIEEAFDAQEIDDSYLEAPEGSCIVAAAEIVAALLGRPNPALPEDAAEWVAEHAALDPRRLVPKALEKLDRLLAKDSELEQLWEENKVDYPAWKNGLLELKGRLTREPLASRRTLGQE